MFPLLFHSSHTAGSPRLHPAHRKWSLCFEKRQERGSYLSNTGNASGQTWHNVELLVIRKQQKDVSTKMQAHYGCKEKACGSLIWNTQLCFKEGK